jgi:hypothetical protein
MTAEQLLAALKAMAGRDNELAEGALLQARTVAKKAGEKQV